MERPKPRDRSAELADMARELADYRPSRVAVQPESFGPWLLLVRADGRSDVQWLPVLERKHRMFAHRYRTPADALLHNRGLLPLRQFGGLLVNVNTGETRKVKPGEVKRDGMEG